MLCGRAAMVSLSQVTLCISSQKRGAYFPHKRHPLWGPSSLKMNAPNTKNCVCCKKGRIYICENNHRNCPLCVIYQGISRTTSEQRLPMIKPKCNVCGEASNLDKASLEREREKLETAIENYRREMEIRSGDCDS